MKALTAEQHAAVVAWLADRWKRCPYCGAAGGREVGGQLLLPAGAARLSGGRVNVARVVVAATCRACAAVGLVEPTTVFAAASAEAAGAEAIDTLTRAADALPGRAAAAGNRER